MKKIFLHIFSAIFFISGSAQSPDSWTQKADFNPSVGSGRIGAAGFSINGKGYIGTGSGYLNDFWEYDPVTNVWTQKANVGGMGRREAVGFSINGKGYIGTGFGYNGSFQFLNDFWEYDPNANAWTQKASFAGTARTQATGISINGKGYIGTGYNGTYMKDFWEYDPPSNIWTQKANFGGTARNQAAGFSVNGKGYIGTGGDANFNYSDFWEYDPTTNLWTQKANFGSYSRSGAVGFSINSKGYIGTGYVVSIGYTKDFWEYNPATNLWTQRANYSGSVNSYEGVGFSINGKGYLGTGGGKDFWEYTPIQDVSIPTITSFSPDNGYTGTSVTITGTGFTGATAVTVGGINVASFTVNDDSHITAIVGAGATGVVSVTNPGGTSSSATSFTYNGYITTVANGDWNIGATWLGGNVPPENANKTLNDAVNINSPVTNNGAITANTYFNIYSTFTNNGTTTIYGSLQMGDGGVFVNNGTISYGPSGSLGYFNYIARTTGDEFPAVNGPLILMASNFGGVTLHASRSVYNLYINAGKLTLGDNNITVGAIAHSTSNNYIVTNGTGRLTLKNISSSPVLFPVGPSTTSYNPITISNGNGDDFSVRVQSSFTNTLNDASKAVNDQWTISKTGNQTGNNVILTPQWNASDEAGYPTSTFNRNGSLVVGHYNGASWDEIPSSAVAGSGPYTTTVTGINSFSPFGVGNTNAFKTCNLQTYYQDADGDGFGNPSVSTQSCTQPAGYVTNNTDCDDNNATIHQQFSFYHDNDGDGYGGGAAVMVCAVNATTPPLGYSINNTDCNDNDAEIHAAITYYRDNDGDGFGDPNITTTVCSLGPPAGYVTNNTDCDDNDAAINPNTIWYKDADGDGYSDGTTLTQCTRPSGYKLATELTQTNGDCDDNNANVHPGATEICGNGIDDNCNGIIDEDVTAPVITSCPSNIVMNNDMGVCGAKVNYALPTATDNCGCSTPENISGYTLLGSYAGHKYFISTNAVNWTSAKTIAASLGGHLVTIGSAGEQNFLQTATTTQAWIGFTDEINEGSFSWVTNEPVTYTNWSSGEPNNAGGIEDYTIINWYMGTWNDLSNGYVYPFIVEFDCDGSNDITISQTGGLPSGSIFPIGLTTNSFDIKDASGNTATCSFTVTVNNSTVWYKDADNDGYSDGTTQTQCSRPTGYKLATELTATSGDCDDNNATIHQQFSFYVDADGDGYGTGSAVMVCAVNAATPPTGYSLNNTDCNDNDATVHTGITYYRDADGDGFGDPNNTITVCSSTPPTGYVTDKTDCDDTKLLYADNDGDGFGAGLPVACGVPNNTDCNDNDATVHTGITYYRDADGDGFGDPNNPTTVCSSTPPAGYVTNNSDCDDTQKLYADNDGDGFGAGPAVACGVPDNTDCNDNDASVHTGITYYRDADGDGFGDPNNSTTVCSSTPPTGYVTNNTDCDDNNAAINPNTIWYKDADGDGYSDGTTQTQCTRPSGYKLSTELTATSGDCNDADASVHTPITYYRDLDGDGFGDPNTTTTVCSSVPPSGYVTNNSDCDDTKLLYADNDHDGYGAGPAVACGVADNTDCNDNDASVHTGITYYRDADGDGFGDPNNSTTVCSSVPPTGYVTNNSDCDDTKLLYADNDEDGFGAGLPVACGVANNTDCNDNDASVHTGITYYRDADGDGFGDPNNTITVCSSTPPTGYVTNNSDCDDTKLLYADNDHDGFGAGLPVACGVANNTDCNDNDASVHTGITYYRDADGDGFGDPNNTITVCSSTPPTGYVTNNSDCDDTKLLYADNDGDGFGAGLPVACGVANNTDCNDNDATVHIGITYYRDADGDGFGDPNNSTTVCSSVPPTGYVTNNSDCDDTKLLYADNDEDGFGAGLPVACGVANNTDCNDNDASVHTGITYYRDADGDGFGDPNNSTTVCSSTPPTGYVTNNSDCDDTKLLYADNDHDGFGAGLPVACGVANNTDCNDNDASVHTGITYYRDADGDGFGDPNNTITVCSSTPPTGYVTNNSDCDDTKLLYADNDHDGFGAGLPVACGVANNTDCNDNDASVHTGITYYRDADGDGFGDPNNPTTVCSSTPPAGYVTNNSDCDDTKLLYADNDHDGFGAGSPVACGVANNTDCNDNDASVHTGCTVNGVNASITDNSITEGNSGYKLMIIKVELNQKSSKIVTVKYKTQNGTATAGSDYMAQSGTIVFLPGMKTSIVVILIKGDKTVEADETFKVVLSNAVNASIAKGTGIETIINDDGVATKAKTSAQQEMEVTVSAIKLMPNPAQNKVNVRLTGYSGNVIVLLSDMNGRKLQEFKTFASPKSAGEQQFDVSKYADGVYFISVIDGKGNWKTEKLIVSK